MKKRDRFERTIYVQDSSRPDKVRSRTTNIEVGRKYIPCAAWSAPLVDILLCNPFR